MGEVLRIDARDGAPNSIWMTVQFRFKLPPELLMRARLGDWQLAEPGVALHVAPTGEIRLTVRNGSELYGRRVATRTAAMFLRELGTDKPRSIHAVLTPGNGEPEIRYVIATGAQVAIVRAVETPELV